MFLDKISYRSCILYEWRVTHVLCLANNCLWSMLIISAWTSLFVLHLVGFSVCLYFSEVLIPFVTVQIQSNFLLINGEGLIMMLNQNQLSFLVPIKQIIKKWLSNIGFHNFTSLWYIPWVSPLTCWITFNSNIHWSKVNTTSLVSATTLHYIAFNKIL
jgi:hypothetical protein